MEVAEAAVRTAPQDELASLVLGIALENAKRPSQAEEAFRRAVELAPASNSMRGNLGGFLLRRRDLVGAQEVAASLDPNTDDKSALLLRGQIALRQGRSIEARDFALWVLQQDANHAGALRLLTEVKASQSPVLGLWWRYALFMGTKPWWHRLLVIVPMMLLSIMILNGLWLAFLLYLRASRAIFRRMLRAEMKTVRLRKEF